MWNLFHHTYGVRWHNLQLVTVNGLVCNRRFFSSCKSFGEHCLYRYGHYGWLQQHIYRCS